MAGPKVVFKSAFHISNCLLVCAGVLHTIIFNRALGPVRPREIDSELFDITYVR